MPEDFPGGAGVQAERLGVGEGFDGDGDVYSAEQLVDQFDLLPVSRVWCLRRGRCGPSRPAAVARSPAPWRSR